MEAEIYSRLSGYANLINLVGTKIYPLMVPDNIELPYVTYFKVSDIPEYAMGYLYEEVVEKQRLQNELFEEYDNMEDKESYKGMSLKNWIDMLSEEIQQKEIFLSLKLRPQWIVKKMLDLCKGVKKETVSFVHFVQEDICEDICPQVVENLRDLGVRVISYNKKHTIQNIVF